MRIAYHIEAAEHEVWVLMIADRNTVWDRHEEEILGRLGSLVEEQRQRRRPSSGGGRRRPGGK